MLSEPRATLPEMGSIQTRIHPWKSESAENSHGLSLGDFYCFMLIVQTNKLHSDSSVYRHCAGDHIHPFSAL